jgi:hypothetical protein
MRFDLVIPALAGLSLLCPPAAAQGADIPGGKQTGAKLPLGTAFTAGTFEKAGDSDWYRVTLEKGRDYAFSLDAVDSARLRLRDAGGRILPLKDAFDASEDDAGFEYRAERTGTYFVEAVKDASADPMFEAYRLRATQDCQDDLPTRCTLTLGEERRQQPLTWSDDPDFLRVTLQRGQTYTVDLATTAAASLALRDRDREVVASASAADGTARIARFRAAYSGSYFVAVTGGDLPGGGTYRVVIRGP